MIYLIINDLNGKVISHCETEKSAYWTAVNLGCIGLQISIKKVSKD